MKTTEKRRAYSKANYRKRVASGLCVYFPNPADKPHIRCNVCRENVSNYSAGKRDIRKLQGLCTICGKEKVSGTYLTCLKCRLKASERARQIKGVKGEKEND